MTHTLGRSVARTTVLAVLLLGLLLLGPFHRASGVQKEGKTPAKDRSLAELLKEVGFTPQQFKDKEGKLVPVWDIFDARPYLDEKGKLQTSGIKITIAER